VSDLIQQAERAEAQAKAHRARAREIQGRLDILPAVEYYKRSSLRYEITLALSAARKRETVANRLRRQDYLERQAMPVCTADWRMMPTCCDAHASGHTGPDHGWFGGSPVAGYGAAE
jgi:hypothetical protein